MSLFISNFTICLMSLNFQISFHCVQLSVHIYFQIFLEIFSLQQIFRFNYFQILINIVQIIAKKDAKVTTDLTIRIECFTVSQ